MKLYETSIAIEEYWQLIEGVILGDITEDPDGNSISAEEALARLEVALANVEGERNRKAVEIACLYKNFIAEANMIKLEKLRLHKRQQAREKVAERLKAYLQTFLPDGEKIKDPKAEIGWRKSEVLILKADPEFLPDEFVKVERKPIVTEIKKVLKAGKKVLGAHLHQRNNIQIK